MEARRAEGKAERAGMPPSPSERGSVGSRAPPGGDGERAKAAARPRLSAPQAGPELLGARPEDLERPVERALAAP